MFTLNSWIKARHPAISSPLQSSMQHEISEVLEKVLSGKERSTEREKRNGGLSHPGKM